MACDERSAELHRAVDAAFSKALAKRTQMLSNRVQELEHALRTVVEVWPNSGKVPGWANRWGRAIDDARRLIRLERG